MQQCLSSEACCTECVAGGQMLPAGAGASQGRSPAELLRHNNCMPVLHGNTHTDTHSQTHTDTKPTQRHMHTKPIHTTTQTHKRTNTHTHT